MFLTVKRMTPKHNLIQTHPFHRLVLSNAKFSDKTRQPDRSVNTSLVLAFMLVTRGTD